ncbi:MAG: septum formation initiator family protein [Deltaproteobacteria bacterium]|nr:septum formation initiator family protein [Deltaproteobacteria bacterium]
MSKYSWIFILVLALAWLAFLFVGDHGLPKLMAINDELSTLKDKNRLIEDNISQTKGKIYSLSNDKFTLERRAREELGLVKQGELVYIFPEEGKAQ